MTIGKLTSSDLERLVLSQLERNRPETMNLPGIGDDVAYIDFGDNILVLSTDPITGATKNAGSIAVHVACNDIAAGGGEPLAIMLTLLAPPEVTEDQIKEVVHQAREAARELRVDIVGGHTEVTTAVTRIILSTTVIGRAIKVMRGPQLGDAIVMTKLIGLEGTAIIAHDMPEMTDYLTPAEMAQAAEMGRQLSVLEDSQVALKYDIHAMHDITEGGLIGALCEVVFHKDFGVEFDYEQLQIAPVTQKIADYYDIDPLQLISSGSMIISLPPQEADALVQDLERAGITAARIGRYVEDKGAIMIKDGQKIAVEPKKGDELYRVIP
ncbi:MAG TPA: hypothetical protein GXZ74_06685 [Tissierellia bacterium]|nr:hypothetical protein [Tissierellia bacterium]